jgi:hypothetical protein
MTIKIRHGAFLWGYMGVDYDRLSVMYFSFSIRTKKTGKLRTSDFPVVAVGGGIEPPRGG